VRIQFLSRDRQAGSELLRFVVTEDSITVISRFSMIIKFTANSL
jgi:predicted RNA-binding protein YlxR (DUF448 family)